MQQTLTFNQLFEQIKQLTPYEQFQLAQKVLATLFQAKFLVETPSMSNQQRIMNFAGCWQAMPQFDYDQFLDDISERRQLAFRRRRTHETLSS